MYVNSLGSCLTGLSLLSHSYPYLSVRRRVGVIKSSNFAPFWATLIRGLGLAVLWKIEANLSF